MTYVLVRYEDNWADEMNITGLLLVEKQEWEEQVVVIKEYFDKWNAPFLEMGIHPRDIPEPKKQYFGTNESQPLQSFEQWNSAITEVIELTDEEELVIRKTIFKDRKGSFLSFGESPELELYFDDVEDKQKVKILDMKIELLEASLGDLRWKRRDQLVGDEQRQYDEVQAEIKIIQKERDKYGRYY